VVALGLARLVNAQACHEAALRCSDFGFVKCVETEKRVALPGPDRVKKLLFELAPADRADDDPGKRPIEQAPESRGNKDS
jgi:hypothetical protein